MNGRQLVLLVAVFVLGLAVGYVLPRNETIEGSDDAIELVSDSMSDSENRSQPSPRSDFERHRQSEGEHEVEDDRAKPARRSTAKPAKREGAFTFQGFDAQGQLSGSWPAAPLGEGRFVIPLQALKAIVSAGIVDQRGRPTRVKTIESLGDQGSFAVVQAEVNALAWERCHERAKTGDSLWIVRSDRPSASAQPASVGRRAFDQEYRFEFAELEGVFDLPAGGYLLDSNNVLCGLALPSRLDEKLRALEFHHLAEDRLRMVELSPADYFRLYYEGSVEALLTKARHALKARDWLVAIDTFRVIVERQPSIMDEIRDEFLQAVSGQLGKLPLSTRAQGRFSFLRQVVGDFPTNGELWHEFALVAKNLREWEEALRGWENTWAHAPGLIADLNEAKNATYFEWADSLAERGREFDALDVIARALSDTNGSVDLLLLQAKLLLKRRRYLDAAHAMREAVGIDSSLTALLDEKIARAERLAEGPGKVVIDYPPGARSIIASIRLNNRATGDFVVDTGATTSMVPEALARSAGLDTSNRVPRVILHTAGNKRTVPFSPVDSISLGSLSVTGISVVVGDLSGDSGHGLLGMDFLGKFLIENDSQNGRLVLTERH